MSSFPVPAKRLPSAPVAAAGARLRFNADAVAIALAGALALLIRFHIIGHIGW